MKNKPRVAIFIDGEYKRSFQGLKILDSLSETFDLRVISSDSKEQSVEDKTFSALHSTLVGATPLLSMTNEILAWRHKARSKSFQFRERRLHPPISHLQWLKRLEADPPLTEVDWTTAQLSSRLKRGRNGSRKFCDAQRGQQILNFVISVTKYFWKMFFLRYLKRALSRDPFFPAYKAWILGLIERRVRPLSRALSEQDVCLLVIPSSGVDPSTTLLLMAAKSAKVQTLVLADNWDNVSSKSTFLVQPNYLGVFGGQSADHAVEIHGFTRSSVFLVGSSKYSSYLTASPQDLFGEELDNYVLFLGTAIPFDELKALQELESAMDTLGDSFENTKIIYRPHPARQLRGPLEHQSLSRVILDPQFKAKVSDGGLDSARLQDFDLSHYPKLLSNARLVVAGPSSMILESILFDKPTVALAVEEDENRFSPAKVWKGFIHFEGVNHIPGVRLCNRYEDLVDLIGESDSPLMPAHETPEKRTLGEFLELPPHEYVLRLKKTILEILVR